MVFEKKMSVKDLIEQMREELKKEQGEVTPRRTITKKTKTLKKTTPKKKVVKKPTPKKKVAKKTAKVVKKKK
ncbi:MAG: hypothetical protein ACOX1V_00790 [Candidatus Iainarchaeum sp.]|jgi:hypothetical protein